MISKNIANLSIILVLILISFFTGFFYSRRDVVIQNTQNQITLKTESGYEKNILSNLKSKPIYGLFETSKTVNGEFIYIINPETKKTDILIKVYNIPFKNSANKTTPLNYKLLTAKICCNGLDYELEDQNFLIKTEGKDNVRSTNFTATLDYDIEQTKIDRLLFYAENNEKNNFKIVKDDIKDWPKNILEKEAPYMWINF